MEGTVKFFNPVKLYGFIISDEDNQEYFVHKSGLVDGIQKDNRVSFDLKDSDKGPTCINVSRI